jgi:hypothetical protein
MHFLPYFVTPGSNDTVWFRNINLIDIDYAFQPRLSNRLTPGGLTLPGKPWVFGEQVFHLLYRYSCQHKLF